MENKKVTVLTPNGRRQNLSITPSTTMLKVLEDVCAKHGFNSDEYDLKHYNNVVDPSAMFRFTGLPNNCLLEMVEVTRKRDAKDVVLCVQLEDGSRRLGTFSPSENLFNVLKILCNDMMGSGRNPVFVYMRKEIFGQEMERTSLKSLGIIDRAMIRLVDRKPEELGKQALVYIPPAKEEQKSDEKPKQAPKRDERSRQARSPSPKSNERLSLSKSPSPKPRRSSGTKSPPLRKSDLKPAGNAFQLTPDALRKLKEGDDKASCTKASTKNCEQPEKDQVPSTSFKRPEHDWGTGGRRMIDEAVPIQTTAEISDDEEMFEEPQLIELGERNAVIFSLAQTQRVALDLPDSFFDLTTDDLKLILRDLRKQAEGTEDEPLLTTKLREMEKHNKILRKMAAYKKCVIRVHFPDKFVLQGCFKPTENLEEVYDFVKGYLRNSLLNFYLFTTPPKTIPDRQKTLVELDFVPTVILHFGVDNDSGNGEDVLKSDLLGKLSSPNGAALAASKSRGKLAKEGGSKLAKGASSPSSRAAAPKKPKPDSFRESSAVAGPSGQVPKWFKPIKK